MSSKATYKKNAAADVREPTVSPGRIIVDSHHHLWPGGKTSGGYLPADYIEDSATHRVTASVFVECMARYDRDAAEALHPVGETRYIANICPAPPPGSDAPFVAAAIVGRAHLHLDARAVRESLEAHVEAGKGRFRGIRYSTIWWPDPEVLPGKRRNSPGLMISEPFRRSFAELAAMNLTFDAFLTYRQLDELIDLADRFPDATIVINHFGAPINPQKNEAGRREAFEAWRKILTEVCLRPNVHMKLGGVGMPVFGFNYDLMEDSPSSDQIASDWKPYLDSCLEAFGSQRCMFESNFATDGHGVSCHNAWNAFKKMTASASEAEQDDLFRGVATRVYNLNLTPPAVLPSSATLASERGA